MDTQPFQNIAADFTRPWSERRGCETIDRNATVVLVRAPLDALVPFLSAQASAVQQDVVGTQVEIQGSFVFTYQLEGHDWSILVEGYVPAFGAPPVLQASHLAALSQHLQQPLIKLLVGDTGGRIGYDLFEQGVLVEYFRGTEGNDTSDSHEYGVQPQRYAITSRPSAAALENLNHVMPGIDPNSLVLSQTAYFWSSRRQVTAKTMGNIWQFPNQLLRDYETYDPALDDRYFLGGYNILQRGERYRVQNPGCGLRLPPDQMGQRGTVTAVPPLVRVDYFCFGH
ncbi:hypothetical protein H6F86_25610 [Phormidium sp. FACHB-592]|uniref:Uncharacterized protein n=1 Tax=Stenomitos frigidus AS-A4 TaxID=2933935 RepID=A0ABV0KTT3_9CYAN|nr:hypothetical protein [Phormidium sp. FACHB-592]MBD2077196.1 hypothetical protein [Phormidium sp. FACHB-592]